MLSEVASAMDGPTTFRISSINSTNCVLEFNASEGFLNDLQYSDGAVPANWKSLTNFVGTGSLVTITDAPITVGARFYRVITRVLQ